jgi:diacylglycerol kinase (ATP)
MAAVGVDAMIMDENLKDKVGSAAYFVAGQKALGRLPLPMTVQLDDHRPVKRDAMLCMVGNVAKLLGNLTLIPGRRPDDGVLDSLYRLSTQVPALDQASFAVDRPPAEAG